MIEVLDGLLSDTRPLVARLLAEDLLDPARLTTELDRFEETLQALEETSLADVETGFRLVRACRELLETWPDLDDRGRHLVQAAVRYLVEVDDGDGDLESAFGFDDDLEVFEAVSHALGRPGLEDG